MILSCPFVSAPVLCRVPASATNGPGGFDRPGPKFFAGPGVDSGGRVRGVVSGASGATEPKENAMSLTTTAPTVTAPRYAATRSARSLRRTTVVAGLVAAAVHGAAYHSTLAAR